MAFGKETVPLALYEDLLAKYHELVNTLATLRSRGFTPKGEIKVIAPPLPAEERAMKRVHDDFTIDMAEHFKKVPGVTEEQARAEAERIRGAFNTDFPAL